MVKLSNINHVYKPVLLSMGSNIGNKKQYLEMAIAELASFGAFHNVQVSSLYETEPLGYTDQDSFLNIALTFWTVLDPTDVFAECKKIEKKLGRKNRKKWHEREIDIDIILFGDEIVATEQLTIPHASMQDRKFVLTPSLEIAAHLIHPIFKKTIQELYEMCSDDSSVVRTGDVLLPS
jgi:2-amino-4-hydroxy-6-hydroxymethyldihydropteridine diphosphokinase